MSFKTFALNALTFGAHDELEAAQAKYQLAYEEYLLARTGYDAALKAWWTAVSLLGDATNKAMLALTQAYEIILFPEKRGSRKLGSRSLDNGTVDAPLKLDHVSQLISTYSAIQSAAGGVGAGSAVAIGSWSLVSIIGTASTGTAISSLTGVAATNATLAWFGGGALAAGGVGMAGGTIMLGGLALVPLVAFATWHARSKIKLVVAETVRVKSEAALAIETGATLRNDQHVADKKREDLAGPRGDLDGELESTKRIVFPTIASRFIKSLKRLFGIEVFDEIELEAVKSLRVAADRVAALFKI